MRKNNTDSYAAMTQKIFFKITNYLCWLHHLQIIFHKKINILC